MPRPRKRTPHADVEAYYNEVERVLTKTRLSVEVSFDAIRQAIITMLEDLVVIAETQPAPRTTDTRSPKPSGVPPTTTCR